MQSFPVSDGFKKVIQEAYICDRATKNSYDSKGLRYSEFVCSSYKMQTRNNILRDCLLTCFHS